MFIDTHCHLSKEYYEDIDSVIRKSNEHGVNELIISGCDKKGIIEGLEIIKKYNQVFMTIGFHPSETAITTEEDLLWLNEIIKSNKKVVGIGEIGLDYHWEDNNKNEQKQLFERQLKLAEKLNLPVVIHSRDATQDTYEILKKYHLRGIIHCYSGSLEMAYKYIELGYYLGIGGVLTFKNSKLRNVVQEIDIKNITLETDSPYLAPEPHRGTSNYPEYIPLIASYLADLKGISKEEVGHVTTNNARTLFDLDNHMC